MRGCKTPAVLRRGRVRGVARGLPSSVWVLDSGMALNALGNGLATPFLLIYLHSVRGFAVSTVGVVPLTNYGVAIIAGIAAGPIVDRIGGRATAAASMVALAGGFAGYPFVHEPWQAFAFAALAGTGTGLFWPSWGTLVARLVPRERRHAAWGVQRVAMNLGGGLGALAGGLIAQTSDATTFQTLFLANAGTYLVFGAIFLLLRMPAAPAAPTQLRPPRYRDVARDRALLGTVAIGMVFAAAGIAQFNSILPVFAKSYAGVGEAVIGVIFLVNTITIVLAQLPVTRAVEGRRRMPLLAGVGTLWGACFCLVLAAWLASAAVAAALLIVMAIAFAVGECVLGVIQAPLVADLAPEWLRGRYMALSSISAQLGYGVGPAIGGVLLDLSPAVLWSVAAAVCAGIAVAALVVEPVLPGNVRTTPASGTTVPAA